MHIFDARFEVQRGRKHVCQLKAFKLQSVEATTTTRAPSQPGLGKASALSLRHPRASLGSESCSRNFVWLVALALLLALAHCPCFAHYCHDPLIARKCLKHVHLFLGFTQFVHPSRCSRSTLTTVCFCFCASVSGEVCIGVLFELCTEASAQSHVPRSLYSYRVCSPFNQIHHRRRAFILVYLFWYPKSIVHLRVPFDVLLPIDPSKNSPFLKHSMLSRSESTLSKCGSRSVPPNLVLWCKFEFTRLTHWLDRWPNVSLLR